MFQRHLASFFSQLALCIGDIFAVSLSGPRCARRMFSLSLVTFSFKVDWMGRAWLYGVWREY
eukprot:scaffold74742_cov29-Tisochrysis_lutea.AAC.1